MQKFYKVLIIMLLLFAVFFAAAVFGVYYAKNKISNPDFLKNFVYKKYGLMLDCKEINTSYSSGSILFNSSYISLKEENSALPFINLEDFSLRLKILPLLFKKISLSEFCAKNISLNLKRQTDGEINLFKYIKLNTNPAFKIDLANSEFSILQYDLNFNDEFAKSNVIINGNNFYISGFDINSTMRLSTSGNITAEKKSSPFLIDIDYSKQKGILKLKKHEVLLYDLDINFLSKYITNLGFSNFNGTVDIYSTAQDNFFKTYFYLNNLDIRFNYKNEPNTVISNMPLVMEVLFDFLNQDMMINSANILGNGIDISYSGKIKNALNFKNVEPELNVKISNTLIKEVLKITPDTLIPFQIPYIKNLKLYDFNAVLNGEADIYFKNLEDFSVNGKLYFDDAYIKTPPKNAGTSFGECEFLGRDVLINVYANMPNDAVLTVFGKSKLQKMPYCEFEIQSFGKIDLEFALNLLNPIQKILDLKMGPLPYMKLKGSGEISLKTAGNRDKSDLYGNFTTNDAQAALQGLNAVLNNASAKIIFDGADITYNGIKGTINGAAAEIDGTANTSGDMNLNVKIKDINAKDAMQIAKTSDIVLDALDGGNFLNSFKPNSGNIDFYLNLSGNIPVDAVFGQQSDSILAKGKIIFNGVDLTVEPEISCKNLTGTLNFENKTDFDLNVDIFNSPFQLKGNIEQKGAQGKILKGVPSVISVRFISNNIPSFSIADFIKENISLFAPQNQLFAQNLAKIFNTNKFNLNADISARGEVYSNKDELDLSGFDFDGTINPVNNSKADFKFNKGNITLKNKNAKFNKISVNAAGINFLMDGNIDKFMSLYPKNNLKLVFYKSPFASYVELFKKIIPEKTAKVISNYNDFKGSVSGNVKLYNDTVSGEFVPENISFSSNNTSDKIELKSGKIKLKNNKTYLEALNGIYNTMPLYADGFIQTDTNINPEFNIYFSTALREEDLDRLINPYIQYPVSIIGEAILKGRVLGHFDSYTTYLNLILNEGSDLFFMGLKFGDTDFKREIASKIKFKEKKADIDYIKYFKYISSQNNKQTPYDIIKISGGVNLDNGEVLFDNLKFTTPNPAPVRFLNPFFKKSIIKDGLFNSNLLLSGSYSNLIATGTVEFSNVFVPMHDSVIDSIKINLSKDTGKAEFALTFFDTAADFTLDFVNKITLPFIVNNISIHSNNVSVDNLIKFFSSIGDSVSKTNTTGTSGVQTNVITPSDIQIKKGNLLVDEILFNNVTASNLKLNFSHSQDTILKIDDAYLAIAGGLIKGSGTYKFDTKDIFVDSDFINCDANELTKAFFNMQGQIYGSANGKFTLSMNNFAPGDYIDKINANAEFEILNGRLAKLGSIEYLLRASNFLKSGLFGLTINNVIELLTPYKHGDFNKISGTFKIQKTNIEDLKIYSQGANLSTYTYGNYNILSQNADIEILGKLSKNISNLLGIVGNTSVVSILNAVTKNKMDELIKTEAMKNISKIPLMDLNNDEFRLFNVKLNGPLSAEDAVKSFTWLN